jgi:shikimate dehydrogenase
MSTHRKLFNEECFMTSPTLYGVMGNPIAHSLSPIIHQAFAQQTQQLIHYERILVPVDGFKTAIEKFRDRGGHGLNITLPFKQEAWQLANTQSEYAMHAKAVNTLVFNHTGIFADNTDGRGLLNDLHNNLHMNLYNKRIAILGAGGAVRGILLPLLAAKPSLCMVVNRTVEKARELANAFNTYGNIHSGHYTDLNNQSFDLIINATSASLHASTLPLPNNVSIEKGCCYDMVYGASALPFLHWGKAHGAAQCTDGLGMLVEQAALSFTLWRHIQPTTKPLLDTLRQQLSW